MVDGGGGKQTEGWTEEWMEGRTSGNTPQCSTGHRPFGAAAQKAICWRHLYKHKL